MLGALWHRAVHPVEAFGQRAREAPELREAVKGMLLARTPVSFLGLVLGYVGFGGLYGRLADPQGEFWTAVVKAAPDFVDPAELKTALAQLPVLPSLHDALPWLLLMAPVMILSVWLHDAAFDHMGLWLAGGLKTRRGVRATLVADAEALQVGVLGAAVGLLGDLPAAGLTVALLLAPVALYFWVLRGFALAAWHGCPPWKGVVATLLHVVLVIVMLVVFLVLCVALVALMV